MRILVLIILLISSNLEARILRIMSYNVENLFDANHDSSKNDWTFLPLKTAGKKEACQAEKKKSHKKECLQLDWTQMKVDLKISQISDVVTNEHTLPDFLGLIEVENDHVVSLLAKKLGYKKFEITNSPDARGVDVALLYKESKDIKRVSRVEHLVPVDYATRNILEVEFLINQKYPLTIFINHWPSLTNPDSWRIKAAEVLANRTLLILKKNPQMAILAMGDFNTIDENNPHPFKSVLFKDNLFSEVNSSKDLKALGTYYYPVKDQWDHLDRFFVNQLLKDGKGLEVVLNSFEIYAPAFISKEFRLKDYKEKRNFKIINIPKRFNNMAKNKELAGFSDHYPIIVKLEYPANKR